MAQAARLSLRMQKELKLLLSDPPPGASFPLLSPNADPSFLSLSTIHAQIEGPEGTVYAKGLFNLTIQIPERYPFQPPSVTFDTPIYHPNIDNGGRICLDILNLPPKGAWQPSLNISTVLMSIGLLLSEPNPDDGLMCEASKEYKYNRQAFDQKAQLMTEKYAKAGAVRSCNGSQVTQSSSMPSKMVTIESEDESQQNVQQCVFSSNKPSGIGQKLSLGSSGSTLKRDVNNRVKEMPDRSGNDAEARGQDEALSSSNEVSYYNLNYRKLSATRQRLSLTCSSYSTTKNGDMEQKTEQNHQSHLNPQSHSPLKIPEMGQPLPQGSEINDLHPYKDACDRSEIDLAIKTSSKRLCLVGGKLSLGSVNSSTSWLLGKNNKENVMPIHNLPPAPQDTLSAASFVASPFSDGSKPSGIKAVQKCAKGSAKELQEIDRSILHEPLRQLQGGNAEKSQLPRQSQNLSGTWHKPLPVPQDSSGDEKQPSSVGPEGKRAGDSKQPGTESADLPMLESIIVLDSEDSEEESNPCSRSKLLVARRPLPRKRGARAQEANNQ